MRAAIVVAALALAPPAGADGKDERIVNTQQIDAVEKEPAVRAMRDELARSIAQLELPDAPKPYFIAYAYWETRSTRVDASFGAIEHSVVTPSRRLAIDLRVGDYASDNSNTTTGQRIELPLPVDDSYDEVRRRLWLATDAAYKSATDSFDRKQAIARAQTKDKDDVGSFSHEPVTRAVWPAASPEPSDDAQAKLEALAQKLSAVFRNNTDAYTGTVSISALRGRDIFVSSEGTFGVQPVSAVTVHIDCTTQAADGMPLHAGTTKIVYSPAQLDDAALLAAAQDVSRELTELRNAPVVDDYAGPVLVTGVAADQILRDLLVGELGGTPLPKSDRVGDRSSRDTALVGKLGKRILPLGVSVVDDPLPAKVGGVVVMGAAKFDDEGIAAQRVSLVENGTLKRLLMSRTPRKGFEHSSGHGYSSGTSPVRARAANVYVTSSRAVSAGELKRRAIAAANDEGNPYILVIEKLADGGGPVPEVMRKLYLDGHLELVRGGTIGGGITLRSLRDILAVGDTPTPLQYDDGAVTGTASISAPALLFRDGDIRKPTGGQRQPPIAPRP